MPEIEAGAPCSLAMVESHPIRVKKEQVTIYVRYRRKNSIFPVIVNRGSQYFEQISKLRPGDQLFVSRDGEEITEVIRNPLWKRLWLQMIWSL